MLHQLKQSRAELKSAHANVEKEEISLRLVRQQEKEAEEDAIKKEKMYKQGQKLIKEALRRERELLKAKKLKDQ